LKEVIEGEKQIVHNNNTIMKNDFWLNLPVKNAARSKEFFTQLGFSTSPIPGNPGNMVRVLAGNKNVVIMLFEENAFKDFSGNEITDTNKTTEVFLNIGAESKEEVNELTEKVKKAGGKVFAEPGEKDGWMYGCGFADLDGHRWGILYMDMSKYKQ